MTLPKSGLQVEATGTQAYIGDLSKAASATDKFTQGLGRAAKDSTGFGEIVTGAFRHVGAMAVEGLAMAGKAVAGFLKDSISSAADVEQTLNVLAVTSGATASEMASISEKAIALGGDLDLPATSAQDAATAMLELSKAGFTAQEAMDAAKGVLQLAAAAEVDAGTAASIAANAINAFGLEAKDAAHVADLLAGGANASSASMTDLSDGLKQAGFAFDASGQSIDDLVTSLAALTNVGLTGSDAGTALKNAMVRLQNPTDKAAGLMKKLGINAYDAQGNMKPWPAVLDNIRTATAGMTQEQRNAALGTIFLSDGMKALLPLLDLTAAEYDALKAKVTEAGSAQAVAGAQTQGFNGAMAGLQSQIETIQLVIGTQFLPLFTPLIQQVSAAASSFGTFVSTFAKLAPALSTSSNPLITFFNILRVATDDAWNPAIAKAQEFALALAPVGAFIRDTLIPAVGEAFVWLGDKLPGAISTVVTWLGTNLPPAIQAASTFWSSTLQPALQTFGDFVTGTVIPNLTNLADWLKVKIPEAVTAATDIWKNVLQPALTSFSSFLTETVIPKLVELNTWLLTNIPGAVQATTDAWTTKIQPAVVTFADYVTGTLVPALQEVNGLLLTDTPAAVTASSDAFNLQGFPAAQMFGDYIKNQLTPIVTDLAHIALFDLTTKLNATTAAFNEGVLPAIKNIATFITGTALGVWEALTKKSQEQNPVLEGLAGAFRNIAKWIDDCTSAVRKFIDAAAKVKVPNLITPGSPTPLEMGLRGIADGAKSATDAIKEMYTTGSAPGDFGAGLSDLMGQAAGKDEKDHEGHAERPSAQATAAIVAPPVVTAAELFQQSVQRLMGTLGMLPATIGSAISMERMTSPVATPGKNGSSASSNVNTSQVYAPVYGHAVQPNPVIDAAIARSMSQW